MIELVCKNCGKTFQSQRRSKQFCSCACSNAWNGAHRETPKQTRPDRIVWSSGGGVQSTAIAVLICQGKLPKPDLALMVDCGYESSRTWEYVKGVTIPRLKDAGVNLQIVPSSRYVDVGLFSKSGHCVLPAFRVNPDGSVSHFSTHCNGLWKQYVTKKFVRESGFDRFVHWIGISTDESRRARGNSGAKYIEVEYPLIDLGLSRKDCAELIRSSGWPMPARTSCIICPQRTMFEWLKLKVECPDDFEEACRIEDEIREKDPSVFLNSRCKPLRDILADD